MPRILIFANGELPDLESARALIGDDDLLIAADGGTRHILALGLTPNVIIGDLDSTAFDLQPLTKRGTRVIEFPQDKDATDLELALEHALNMDPTEIIIVAALGGRLDQTLGNIALLATPQPTPMCLDDGVEETFFCRGQVKVHGRSGDIVSLIPWGGEVKGILTENLRWPLVSETLYPNKTRGISNEMLGEEASVKIESGLLLVVHHRANTNSTDRETSEEARK
ncbi:MAG: thiamine diphosphokinase [Chloroflexota bacterium]